MTGKFNKEDLKLKKENEALVILYIYSGFLSHDFVAKDFPDNFSWV